AIERDRVCFEIAGKSMEVNCKQVIIAMGAQPDDSLPQQLRGGRASLHRIGDCRDVGYIEGALLDARQLVQQLESRSDNIFSR
ncbi:MAG: hypothetical protein ACRCVD_08745, partial [Halioglobus sp.]